MLEVNRKEMKYLISDIEVACLRSRLSRVMDEDPHNGEDGYLVRSLYFDTLFDRDFEDKVDGYDRRQKIRLRVYDLHSNRAKLELKEKVGSVQRKRSLPVSREEAERMTGGDYSFLLQREEEIAHKLYAYMTTHCYRPKCIVEYDRLAFCVDSNDIRVTFDRKLRATEADLALFREDLPLYPVSEPGEVTMEVKYHNFLFTHIKNIVSQSGQMQTSNSKYCRARRITKRGRR